MSKARLPQLAPGPITLDVVGLSLTAADQRRILHPLTGGVILFGRNFTDRAQLTKLTASIKALRPDVLISIDHEGGRVLQALAAMCWRLNYAPLELILVLHPSSI